MRAIAIVAPVLLAVLALLAVWGQQTPAPPRLFDPTDPKSASNVETLRFANSSFTRGVELRADAAQARKEFAAAAEGYDRVWSQGFHDSAIALNRARAHRLAGELPASILALHDGLAIAPFDRKLQAALAEARSAVVYPVGSDLESQCRPTPRVTIGSRMSPREAAILAGLLWLLSCLAIARYTMTRMTGWLWFTTVCLGGLLTLGILWWQDARLREEMSSRTFSVVVQDASLRKGNAVSYPPRFESRLPRGAEVNVLGERGGWLHVELAGGAAGWLPADALLP